MESEYIFERIVFPSGEGNPRNGEGDVVRLSDGRLLMVYGEFVGGSDSAPATLQGVVSTDRGRTWGGKHTVQQNIGQENVMCASLLRLQNGEMLLGFLRKDKHMLQCTPFVRRSADEGRTWSEPEPVTPPRLPFYYVVNNSRMVGGLQGRMAVPAERMTW